MAIYAIGDIQGCYDDFVRLLDRIEFEPARDRLWLTGDLVNRGPDSLKVLRRVYGLGSAALTVLGNHDLHLLAAVYAPGYRTRDKRDSFNDVLQAPDREELLDWLRRRPLLHYDASVGAVLIHAGLPPQWDLKLAESCAREVEVILRGEGVAEFFAQMYDDEPDIWSDDLSGHERTRFIVNCFTRLRFCDSDGRLDLSAKGPPGTQSEGLLPWFRVPDRRSAELRVVFGHWSTLGRVPDTGVISTDTGCVWGRRLTAVRLDGPEDEHWVECRGIR